MHLAQFPQIVGITKERIRDISSAKNVINILEQFQLSQENFLRDAQNDSSPALPELADAVK